MQNFGTKLLMISAFATFVFSPLMMNAAAIYDSNKTPETYADELIYEEDIIDNTGNTDNINELPQTGAAKVCYKITTKIVNGKKKLVLIKVKCVVPTLTTRPRATSTKKPAPSNTAKPTATKKVTATSTTKPTTKPTSTPRY